MRHRLSAWALVPAVCLLAAATARAHDEPTLSEFGAQPGLAYGAALRAGTDYRNALTTERLREAPSLGRSSVMALTYRRRIEVADGQSLLVGGELTIVHGFATTQSGGAVLADGVCGLGTARHEEQLEVQTHQDGVFGSVEYRWGFLDGALHVEPGLGFGFYRIATSAHLTHVEWCDAGSPPTAQVFRRYTSHEFEYRPGIWCGLTAGWACLRGPVQLDLVLGLRFYAAEGFAFYLRSDTDTRTLSLHYAPSFFTGTLGLVLTF